MPNGKRARAARSIAALAAAGFALGGCVGWDRVFPNYNPGGNLPPAAIAPSCWTQDQQAWERALWRRH